MSQKIELWHFVASRLANGESVMLLVVGASSGSSPGRAGYKMAVAPDGELCGSIGGGRREAAGDLDSGRADAEEVARSRGRRSSLLS